MLTYAFKNVNLSNLSRVSKRDVKPSRGESVMMVAFKLHVFDALLFEETPDRSNSEIRESFLS